MEDFHAVMNAGIPFFLVGVIIFIVLAVLWGAAGEISGSTDIKERIISVVKIVGWGVFYIGVTLAVIIGVSYLFGLVAIKLGMN
jgi:hypothetical protein